MTDPNSGRGTPRGATAAGVDSPTDEVSAQGSRWPNADNARNARSSQWSEDTTHDRSRPAGSGSAGAGRSDSPTDEQSAVTRDAAAYDTDPGRGGRRDRDAAGFDQRRGRDTGERSAAEAQPTTALPAFGGFADRPAGRGFGERPPSGSAAYTAASSALSPPQNRGSAAEPTRPARNSRAERGPRRARLQLRHLNVWSVLKFSCVLAIALFFLWLIMVGVLYGVLDTLGVFDRINQTVGLIDGSSSAKNVVTPGIVFGAAAVIGAVNILLFIVLSTIGSVVYNLCSDLVGGIEVTLSERD